MDAPNGCVDRNDCIRIDADVFAVLLCSCSLAEICNSLRRQLVLATWYQSRIGHIDGRTLYDVKSPSSNARQAVATVPFKEYSTQVVELLHGSKRLAGEWASQLGQTPHALLYNVVSLSQVHAGITSFACRDISTHIKKLTCQWKDHTLIAWWNSCHGISHWKC